MLLSIQYLDCLQTIMNCYDMMLRLAPYAKEAVFFGVRKSSNAGNCSYKARMISSTLLEAKPYREPLWTQSRPTGTRYKAACLEEAGRGASLFGLAIIVLLSFKQLIAQKRLTAFTVLDRSQSFGLRVSLRTPLSRFAETGLP
jgi:hypothetical protein